MSITLSKEQLDASNPGYQAPLPEDQVKPASDEDLGPLLDDEEERRGRGRRWGCGAVGFGRCGCCVAAPAPAPRTECQAQSASGSAARELREGACAAD
jgi:hypothetical protein